MWMIPNEYCIHVYNCRAAVVRRVSVVRGGSYYYYYEPAANWEELEDAAREAVEGQGGALNLSGLYYCPLGIIQRARWPQRSGMVEDS